MYFSLYLFIFLHWLKVKFILYTYLYLKKKKKRNFVHFLIITLKNIAGWFHKWQKRLQSSLQCLKSPWFSSTAIGNIMEDSCCHPSIGISQFSLTKILYTKYEILTQHILCSYPIIMSCKFHDILTPFLPQCHNDWYPSPLPLWCHIF